MSHEKAYWLKIAKQEASKQGLPPGLIEAVMGQESGGNQYNSKGGILTSHAGAMGLMQLMPATARGLGVDPNDPIQNIQGGVRYLAQQYKKFKSIPLALAAYNAGPGAVEKYGGIPPYKETQNYVRKITSRLGGNSSAMYNPEDNVTPNNGVQREINPNLISQLNRENSELVQHGNKTGKWGEKVIDHPDGSGKKLREFLTTDGQQFFFDQNDQGTPWNQSSTQRQEIEDIVNKGYDPSGYSPEVLETIKKFDGIQTLINNELQNKNQMPYKSESTNKPKTSKDELRGSSLLKGLAKEPAMPTVTGKRINIPATKFAMPKQNVGVEEILELLRLDLE